MQPNKIVEVHDNGSTIFVLAIKMAPETEHEKRVLFEQSGFDPDGESIVLIELDTKIATDDPYQWPSLGIFPRTLPVVHEWLKAHYDEVIPEQVIDVAKMMAE